MQESHKAAGWTIGVAMLIIGGLIGWGITAAVDKDNGTMQSMTPTAATKAADLRSNLVTLGVEHMTYTDQAVDAALDGSPNATQLDNMLNQNGKDIGAAVGSIYGKGAETTFDNVWQIHLNDFVKYAVADSKGDTSGMAAALSDIDANYTKPLAQYLAKANPNLPESALEGSLRDHVNMTAQMIDDHVKGRYSDEATELGMANTHIEGLFSTLADGIVKQFPNKF